MIRLTQPLSLFTKLGSIVVHAEELLSSDGHAFDRAALESLLADGEVREWLDDMAAMALLPVKRKS